MKKVVAACLLLAAAAILAGGVGCQTAVTMDGLAGDWLLVELGGEPLELAEAERAPSISFDEATSRAEGFAGCNNFFGNYVLDGSAIKFGPIGATHMACPGMDDNMETRYLAALGHTRAWRIKGRTLQLLAEDIVLAQFKTAHEEL
jgi:heat shock protein HslJ